MCKILQFKTKDELHQEEINKHWAELLDEAQIKEYTDEETCNGMHQPIEE